MVVFVRVKMSECSVRKILFCSFYVKLPTDRQTDRQTNGQTDKRRVKHNLFGRGNKRFEVKTEVKGGRSFVGTAKAQ